MTKHSPLVFIHGIKGGRLANAGGHLRWISSLQGLGLDRRRLMAPTTWTSAGQERDDLQPDGPLHSVLRVPVYAPFLDWAQQNRGPAFHPFAYDWRRDLLETVRLFEAFLEGIAATHGRPPQVVAHSMGGLITWLLLRRRPELVSSVLFAGVPFGAGVSFGESMHEGAPIGLNTAVADRMAHCSWTAPYCFFPAGPDAFVRGGATSDINDPPIDHDWYDADCWEQQRLGPFAAPLPSNEAAVWRNHLRQALQRGKTVRTELDEPAPSGLPPLAALVGVGHPCIRTANRDRHGNRVTWTWRPVPEYDGDDSVASHNAKPPRGASFIEATSSQHHQKLLDDLGLVASLLGELDPR